jgi:hypothetical protein
MEISSRNIKPAVVIHVRGNEAGWLASGWKYRAVVREVPIAASQHDQDLVVAVEGYGCVRLSVAVEISSRHLVAVLVAKKIDGVRRRSEAAVAVSKQHIELTIKDRNQVQFAVKVEVGLAGAVHQATHGIRRWGSKRTIPGVHQDPDAAAFLSRGEVRPAVAVVITDHHRASRPAE